jgi:hypothetical protein
MNNTSQSSEKTPRREFVKQGAGMAAAAALGPLSSLASQQAAGGGKTIGIQVGAVSFVDEGVDKVLDNIQNLGQANTIFLNTFGWDRGLNGRQIYGHPFPDHGKQEYDVDLVGGNYATPHPQYYSNTILKDTRAPDYPDVDILELVLPKARQRGMKVYAACIDSFRGSVPNIQKLSEVDLFGNRVGAFCNLNPDWRNFVIGLIEDTCKSYDVDGVLWFAERNGPLLNTVGASHAARIDPFGATCFCDFHQAEAKERGIDVERAREGFIKLGNFVRQAQAGQRPSDGYFVEFLRILLKNPEIIAWEKLWVASKLQLLGEVYGAAKSSTRGEGYGQPPEKRRQIRVGFHVEHVNSFNFFYRAEQDYEELARSADFLKIVAYNNAGGPRYARFIDNLTSTLFRDVPPDEMMRFNNFLLNYKEKAYQEVPTAGLSSDYVGRETRRALDGVKGICEIYPGIDIDIPTGKGLKQTSPDDVYGATLAALKAGAQGVIYSRKYSEMKLANLGGGGRAVKEFLRG